MSDGLVRVFVACSLDGFIAGLDDDLSFLQEEEQGPPPTTTALTFQTLMDEVGVLVMGRRTYDVVASFGADAWAYGETPVWVMTHRPLNACKPTVTAHEGDLGQVLLAALEAAKGQDVYLDGGQLVRQALGLGLVDELVLTYVPILLGDGVRLFDRQELSTKLRFSDPVRYGHGMVQVRAAVVR